MIGKTISHYRILDKIGEGRRGEVWKALDTRLDRPVALKFLRAAGLTDPTARARLLREARTASKLAHRPDLRGPRRERQSDRPAGRMLPGPYAHPTLGSRPRGGIRQPARRTAVPRAAQEDETAALKSGVSGAWRGMGCPGYQREIPVFRGW